MTRNNLATGAAVVVLALVLAVVWATRPASPVPAAPPSSSASVSASASPTASAAIAPTASPTGVAGLDDRFGFIVTSGSGVWLRPETDLQKRTTLTGRWFVASPDGTQVAFWRESGNSEDLFVMSAARPDQERSVYKVPAGQQGVQIVWASDGSGLLFTVQRPTAAAPTSGPTVLTSMLVTLDLRTAATTTVGTLTDGRVYLAIAWDRSANLAAAGESSVTSTSPRAPVMETYLTVKTGGPIDVIRRPVTEGFAIPLIVGSPDARYVYARSDSVRFWPLADYSAMGSFQATGLRGKLLWRPGTTQVAWLDGSQLNAYDVSTKSAITLFRGIAPNPATGTDLGIFRVDGTAAVVGPVSVGPGVVAPMTLVSLGPGTSIQVDTGGAIGSGFIASVRLR